jgi:hypothetical protein
MIPFSEASPLPRINDNFFKNCSLRYYAETVDLLIQTWGLQLKSSYEKNTTKNETLFFFSEKAKLQKL